MHQNPDLRAVYDEEVLAIVGISFFSVYLNALFCFVFLLPNSISVSYTCNWVNHSHSSW